MYRINSSRQTQHCYAYAREVFQFGKGCIMQGFSTDTTGHHSLDLPSSTQKKTTTDDLVKAWNTALGFGAFFTGLLYMYTFYLQKHLLMILKYARGREDQLSTVSKFWIRQSVFVWDWPARTAVTLLVTIAGIVLLVSARTAGRIAAVATIVFAALAITRIWIWPLSMFDVLVIFGLASLLWLWYHGYLKSVRTKVIALGVTATILTLLIVFYHVVICPDIMDINFSIGPS